MQKLVAKQMDPHPCSEQFVVVGALSQADEHLIRDARHHQIHSDSAQDGRPERIQQRFIRDEVGGRNHNPFVCPMNESDDEALDPSSGVIRPARQHLRDCRPGTVGSGKNAGPSRTCSVSVNQSRANTA